MMTATAAADGGDGGGDGGVMKYAERGMESTNEQGTKVENTGQ